MIKENLRRLLKNASKIFNYSSNLETKELLYFQAFLNLLPEKHDFYPFGGSANSSLLYFLGRFLKEFRGLNIVELGMGQTTMLLNMFVDNQANHFSIDDNEFWIDSVKSKLINPDQSQLIFRNLTEVEVSKNKTLFYQDFESIFENKIVDLVIVDGPKGTKKFSRCGILPFLVKRFSDQDDMLVIFDDTHRKPELETFHLLIKMLKNENHWNDQYKIKYINAMKSQACLIKGKKFLSANYY
tara:strand:- start:152 stop:874 length:723 start_codon:yes stop_codon:yes gene_type:complete